MRYKVGMIFVMHGYRFKIVKVNKKTFRASLFMGDQLAYDHNTHLFTADDIHPDSFIRDIVNIPKETL